MPIDRYTQQAEQLLKELWENRAAGISSPALQWEQLLTPSALSYLKQRYPFLQIMNSEATFEDTVVPAFKQTTSGWVIHDYGQAMSASRGEKLYNANDNEEGGGDGTGTLTRQTIDTAQAMIALAIEKGWAGVEIVAGSELMQFAAWMAAQDKGFALTGYKPTAQDQKKRERIKRGQAASTAEKTHDWDMEEKPQLD
jgi:hypothetical protein